MLTNKPLIFEIVSFINIPPYMMLTELFTSFLLYSISNDKEYTIVSCRLFLSIIDLFPTGAMPNDKNTFGHTNALSRTSVRSKGSFMGYLLPDN